MIRRQLIIPLLIVLCFSPVYIFAEKQTILVDYGKLYEVAYDADGVTIFEVVPNQDDAELIFEIDVSKPAASLEIVIPRELLDASENGMDTSFFVIADGDVVNFSEKETTDTTRTLFIELEKGTQELEIFGSSLIGNIPKETNQETPQEMQPTETEQIPENVESEEPSQVIVPEASDGEPTKDSEEESSTPIEPVKETNDVQSSDSNSGFQMWSMQISKRQATEFAFATAVFVALAIVLAAIKGSRKEEIHS